MNKKIFAWVLAGIAAAALACIITGIVMYSVAIAKQISVTAPDYSVLMDQKKAAVAVGLLMVIVGCTFISLPVAGSIYLLVDCFICKRRAAKAVAVSENVPSQVRDENGNCCSVGSQKKETDTAKNNTDKNL